MSLENLTTREKPSPLSLGEGRREQEGKQPAPAQRSGGVCVDSTSVSQVRISWENCGDGNETTQASGQAGHASKTRGVAAEVGVPHSKVLLGVMSKQERAELREMSRRGDTYSTRRGEGKDAGMAGATQIVIPPKVRKLQIALYRSGLESCLMNEFGEPNMGNPSVRFDEGRERPKLETDNCGQFNSSFAPAYSTSVFRTSLATFLVQPASGRASSCFRNAAPVRR